MRELLALPLEASFASFAVDVFTPQVIKIIETWFKSVIKEKKINREKKNVKYVLKKKDITFILNTKSVVYAGICQDFFRNPLVFEKGLLLLPLMDLDKANILITKKIYSLLALVYLTLQNEENEFWNLPYIHIKEKEFKY